MLLAVTQPSNHTTNVCSERKEIAPPYTYRLPDYVYGCTTTQGTILLDLRRDKYVGISLSDSAVLGSIVEGWPSPIGFENPPPDERERIAVELLENGLLSNDFTATSLTRVSLTERVELGIGPDTECRAAITFKNIVDFARAYSFASWQLRYWGLNRTVNFVRARKSQQASDGVRFDFRTAEELIVAFRRIRAFVFGVDGRCLFHALVLIHFLSKYHLYPFWVIGITTAPWSAHSWVQQGKYCLDALPQDVLPYTPILAV